MARLLVGHARDRARRLGAIAHYRELAGIDSRCAKLAGLVDADHGRGGFAPVAGPPAFHTRSRLPASAKMMTAAPNEMIALNPASEIPANLHCATSQRMIGAR